MLQRHTRITLGALWGFAGACAPGNVDSTSFAATTPVATTQELTSTGETSGAGNTSDTSSTRGSTSSTAMSSSGSGTSMLWDLGTTPDIGVNTPPGCKGKVDFLFAISRGNNMMELQAQLISSFNPFIESIKNLGGQFADFDFHIMVVDGEQGWGSPYCDDKCEQNGLCDLTPAYPCGYEPSACDAAKGAGTIYNAGRDAANKSCGLAGGKRFLDTTTWDLEKTFACIAQVGTAGQDDLGNSLTEAVSTQRDLCNKGFLRDDALLVVTHIMQGSSGPGIKGTPEIWANVLLQAKGGDADAIVMLGMNQWDSLEACIDKDMPMCAMLALFQHHVYADVDAPSYGAAFQATVDLIDIACSEFVPG